MKRWLDLAAYAFIAIGMAIATASFTMVGAIFGTANVGGAVGGIVIAAILCLLVAASIGEQASMFPTSPGIRTYTRLAFGDGPSLALVYLYLSFVVLGAGVEAYTFGLVVAQTTEGMDPLVIGVGATAVVAATNAAGLNLPRWLQIVTSVILVLMIGGLASISISSAEPARLAAMVVAPVGLPTAAGLAIFLLMGFEWVTPLGLRPDCYRFAIPWSMPVSIIVNASLYLLVVVAVLANLDVSAVAGNPVPHVAWLGRSFPAWGFTFALVISALALFTTFNAGLMGGARMLAALAQERALPRWFGYLSPRTGVPLGAISVLGILTATATVVVRRPGLVMWASAVGAAVMCIVYAAFIGAAVQLRKLRPTAKRPFRSPVPVVVQGGVAVLMLGLAVASLLSQPSLGWGPAAGLAGCVGLSLFFAAWSRQVRQAGRVSAGSEGG